MVKVSLAIFVLLNIIALVVYGLVQIFQASVMGGIYLTALIGVLVYLGIASKL